MRALAPNARTALDKMVRESGVKDSISHHIMESLIQLGNDLWNRRQEEGLNNNTIQQLLNDELRHIKSAGPIQNPGLDMEGQAQQFQLVTLSTTDIIWIYRGRYAPRYTDRDPSHNTPWCSQVLLGTECLHHSQGKAV
jgi:hypothetical protein